jgi:regulator of cell morphogenesis and NO signaling
MSDAVLATINDLPITLATTACEIASAIPGASKAFVLNRMDWCCKGAMSLGDHCREAGVDPVAFLGEVAAAASTAPRGPDWRRKPTPELVAHILTFHDAHRRDLPALGHLINDIEVAAPGRWEEIQQLADTWPLFAAETERHLAYEEETLFPAVAAGDHAALGPVMTRLREEHEGHDHRLADFRTWCEDFRIRRTNNPRDEALRSVNDLHRRLEVFELELMEHMHLENNLLFPRLAPPA